MNTLATTTKLTSDDVYRLIQKAGATTKRSEKEQIVRENIADIEFSSILQYALNPYWMYGMTGLPVITTHDVGDFPFREATFWILDKLRKREATGHAARDLIMSEARRMTSESRALLHLILKKDLGCGITADTVNRVAPGMIPSFKVMLAHPLEEKRVDFPCWVEPKLDGYRVVTLFDGENVRFVSREGIEWTCFDHLKPVFFDMVSTWISLGKVLPGAPFALDGECLAGEFNETASALRSKGKAAESAVYHVFDVLPGTFMTDPLQKEDKRPYEVRRQQLENLFTHGLGYDSIRIMPVSRVESMEEIHALYGEYQARGFEGVIVKDRGATYEKRRSWGFMKMKAENSVDCVITGIFEGKDSFAGTLGGVIVDFNGVEVRVGSGFTLDYRRKVWNKEIPDPIGRLAEVLYHEVTPAGSLRHTRFKRFRDTVTGAKE